MFFSYKLCSGDHYEGWKRHPSHVPIIPFHADTNFVEYLMTWIKEEKTKSNDNNKTKREIENKLETTITTARLSALRRLPTVDSQQGAFLLSIIP